MSELPKFVVSRLHQASPADHPDADLLTAFAEKSLTEREHSIVLSHLAACSHCRDVIALATLPEPEPIRLDRLVASVEPPHSWFRWSVLRWGAAAACAIIVSAAVFLTERKAGPQTT